MHNLAVNLERSASLFPNKVALRMGTDEVSFSQLEQLSGNVAANLKRLGLKKGDKVALSCPNVTYFPIAYYGILKAGCVVVPLNVLFKAREIVITLMTLTRKPIYALRAVKSCPSVAMAYKVLSRQTIVNTLSRCPSQPAQTLLQKETSSMNQSLTG